jgi:hypothetical protein
MTCHDKNVICDSTRTKNYKMTQCVIPHHINLEPLYPCHNFVIKDDLM